MTPPIDPGVTSTLTMGHVLFMDIVAYSRLPMDEQRKLVAMLQETVRQTRTFAQAQQKHRLISIPTGDGIALVFFEDPESPVRCAVELSQELRGHPEIKLRMGIHTGPVYRVADINANQNVAGGGINMAQRVMDCGDEGHILVSEMVADTLLQLGKWDQCLHDLGETEVKHGFRVHLYNLYTGECGNPTRPQKMRSVVSGSPSSQRLSSQEPSPTMPEHVASGKATQRIGDYEIIRELGRGGMGQVYLVRNVLSDRIEAMKVLLPDMAGHSDLVTRFTREIKVLASLEHPNIAALRTAFTADNQFVMIMEYVEGDTLAHLLERGRFSTQDSLNYADQVLAALSYAHGKGVIHRDIKPGNMMLTPQGMVKLMDFGLARTGSEIGLTMTGTTIGSLDFMSPEQVKSEPTDERSDLYSVGVSLYQMVTGQRMFSVTSSYSIMQAQVEETPRPPIEIQPTLPKAVSDLIMMAVAKDPAQRFQSADAFRNALSQMRESVAQPSTQAATASTSETLPPGVSAMPPVQPAVPQTAPVSPVARDERSGPTASPASLAPEKRNWGLLLAIAVVLLVVALAGAWAYKSRQHSEVGTKDANVSNPQANAAPVGSTNLTSGATTQGSTSATPPTQPPAATTTTAPASQPEAPKDVAPPASEKLAANKADRHNPKPAPAMAPGGAAQDSDPPQPAVDMKKLMDDLENETDHLDSRAAAVESSLDTLEQQMHRDGLGLRGDMVTARSNMRTDLSKAKQALGNADTERARHYLDLAHREVERLEAFLGHR